jgi:hypothetical protein
MKKFLTISVFAVILIFSVSCSVEDDLSLPDDEGGFVADNETELPDARIDDSNEFPDTNNNEPDNTTVPDESTQQPDDFDEQPDEPVIPTEMLPNNQWGTTGGDGGKAVRIDSEGNVIVTGIAIGGLDGNACVKQPDNQCSQDIFVSKWVGGTRIWTKQWGTNATDVVLDMVLDGEDNIYLTGLTSGAFEGQTCVKTSGGICSGDIFVTKLDKNGGHIWTIQWGSDEIDGASGITLDKDGNIIIAGASRGSIEDTVNTGGNSCRSVADGFNDSGELPCYDTYLAKISPDGEKLWAKMWGTDRWDEGSAVAVDAENAIYVTGVLGIAQVDGNGKTTAVDVQSFLTKLDADGEIIWTKQWGTDEDDYALAVAVDNEGNAIVSGKTKGALPNNSHKGEYDIYVIKFDTDGAILWTTQYGTDKSEEANRIEIDSAGNIYIGGSSKGSIDGQTNAGNPLMATEDPFVSKFDSNGSKLWTQLRGGTARDVATGMALDSNGTVFLTGETYGAFPGTVSIGGRDIFLLYFLNQ